MRLNIKKALDQLKQVMTKELVLVMPIHSKPFEVEINASNYSIGGVLMQGHLVTFESSKMKWTEWRYMVQEKAMTMMVYCLRTWRNIIS